MFNSIPAVFFARISESLSPTPHYNSSILQDLIMEANEEYRATILGSHPNLKDGILLLKVWLKQRGLDQVSSLNFLFRFWVVLIDGM
jgi:Nrap protein.